MTTISNLPKDLQGKEIVIRQGTLDLDLQFGLWVDYTHWLDSDKQLKHWYDSTVLEKENVSVKISLGTEIVLKKVFTQFENITLHHVFNDMESRNCDLTVEITNLSNLPIRDDTGMFVSGLFKINSIKLQGIKITHLLDNTMFSNDTVVSIPMTTPIYPWMLANYQKILPTVFNFPITDIVTIN
jgi:hypothetical protein